MKRHLMIWAGMGFLVACCWVLYTFVVPAEQLVISLRKPMNEALLSVSCPIAFAGRYFPLRFWWVPPINAATYAMVGLIVEILQQKSHPSPAI